MGGPGPTVSGHAVAAPRWSLPAAALVAAAPVAGAIVAATIEMQEPGESPMWLVAAAFFLVSPVVGAAAGQRASSPTLLRLMIAAGLCAVLFAIWIVNVPSPTHAGVFVPGGSRKSGAVMAGLVGVAWLVATSSSGMFLRRGSPLLALVLGGLCLTGLCAVAVYAGMATP
jgi:hypothetical protein